MDVPADRRDTYSNCVKNPRMDVGEAHDGSTSTSASQALPHSQSRQHTVVNIDTDHHNGGSPIYETCSDPASARQHRERQHSPRTYSQRSNSVVKTTTLPASPGSGDQNRVCQKQHQQQQPPVTSQAMSVINHKTPSSDTEAPSTATTTSTTSTTAATATTTTATATQEKKKPASRLPESIPETNCWMALMVTFCMNPVFGLAAIYFSMRSAAAYRDGYSKTGARRAFISIVISMIGITVTMVLLSGVVVSRTSNSLGL